MARMTGSALNRSPAAGGAPIPAALAPALVAVFCAVALVSTAPLRSLHREVPNLPGVPLPWGSLLFPLALTLIVWSWWQQRRGRAPLTHRAQPSAAFEHLVPWLALLVAEKWLTGPAAAPLFDRLDLWFAPAPSRDAALRACSGAVLLVATLLLLPLVRSTTRRMRRSLTWQRLKQGLVIAMLATVVVGLPLGALAWGVGAEITLDTTPTARWAALAQVVLAIAEEVFYRGTLQISVIGLLLAAGCSPGRWPRLLGIGVVSVGFALEHVTPTASPDLALRSLLYVLLMSVMLGTLLESSRNLYLAMVAHAGINLGLVELIPLPRLEDGTPLLSGATIGLLWIVAVFGCVAIEHTFRARQRAISNQNRSPST